MLYITTQFPFFGLPIIRLITRLAVDKVITIAINDTEFGGFVIFSKVITKEQAAEFDKHSKKNDEVQKNGTPEEKQKAKQDLINATRNLVKYNR